MVFAAAYTFQSIGSKAPPVLQAVHVLFGVCTLAALLMTGCTDPGIVRRTHQNAEEGRGGADAGGDGGRRQQRRRFCDYCGIYQEPGTGHCDDCMVCVEELDHHCPWMGKCVGKRNMPYFKLFNGLWLVFIFFLFVEIIATSPPEHSDEWKREHAKGGSASL